MKTIDKNKYSGVIVPMVTPLAEEGKIDLDAMCQMIDYLCDGGVSGIFVLGTTGEAVSIEQKQKIKLVDTVVRYTNARAVVYAGISDTCFDHSVQAAQSYFELGIDVAVAHLPWYYALKDNEIYCYFTQLADAVEGALMLYNIPKTTHMSIPIEIIEKLSNHRRIVGLKDSENNLSRVEKIIEMRSGRDDFSYALGCAPLSAQAVSLGADAIVPSSANLVPKMYRDLFESALGGDSFRAETLQQQTNRVSAMYQEGRSLGQSLAALKAMMGVLGLCRPTVLPPLKMLSDEERNELEKQMRKEAVFQPLLRTSGI